MSTEELVRDRNHLYVIFHGSWAFVDNEKETCIHAYAADIPEHTFIGGSWCGERKIVRGTQLELAVGNWTCDKGKASTRVQALCPEFVLFCQGTATPAGAYAEVLLPRPTTIIPEVFAGDLQISKPFCDSSRMYLVPVFHYEYDASVAADTIVLKSIPRTGYPFWAADKVDKCRVTTLHLFAADDMTERKNGGGDFSEVAKLLGYSVNVPAAGDQEVDIGNLRTTIPRMEHRSYEITTFLNKRVDWLHKLARERVLPEPKPGVPVKLLDYTSCGGGGGGS